MEEPPDQYRCRDDEQAEDLISTEGAPLEFAPFVFGDLLVVRLDAAFNHVGAMPGTTDQYRWIAMSRSEHLAEEFRRSLT